MIEVFAVIGLFSSVSFLYRHRESLLDYHKFFAQVRSLRGYDTRTSFHRDLDNLVENVLGRSSSAKEKDSMEDLESQAMLLIEKIKKQKEQDKNRSKAQKLIEHIKKSLDE